MFGHMKTRRIPKLACWLAGIYLAWSLLVFFGSFRSGSHEMWPLGLYFIIWPVSTLYEFVSSVCMDRLVPDPKSASNWIWALNDYIDGAFYIIVGTIWIWFLGKVISRVVTCLFPIREQETMAEPNAGGNAAPPRASA